MEVQALRLLVYLMLFINDYICVNGGPLSFDKSVKITRLLNCPEYKNSLVVNIDEVRITSVRKMFYISAKLGVKRNTVADLKLVLRFERCSSRENLDSCEPYKDLLMPNICDLWDAKFQIWTSFVSSIHPKFGCPVQKGNYTCQNGTVDAAALSLLPISGFYWRLRSILYEFEVSSTVLPVLCIYSEGEIIDI